ncbi:MAG: pilus assembly protein TadG-related protein [Candidatus Limnocylindrales bacterium]
MKRAGTSERGQVLVLVVFSMVGLMAAAGLAFDVGRFYSERRFLQNAADAGALAVANALIRGEPNANAEAMGRDVLARNLLGSPVGTTAVVATTPEYEVGYPGDPLRLTSGILITGGEVRVALYSDVNYTFGRAVGLGDARIGAQARVETKGDLLPIAIRHYINAPGPSSTAAYPCDGNPNRFQDLISTANTSCLGSSTDAVLRTIPTPGMAFDAANPNNDPANHGPIIALVGQGAQPSNNAAFRGFVALDIRNFSSATSNVFYNGATGSMNANLLKDLEAGWVPLGYPGPAFPPVTTPADPNDQIGILDGNSAGQIVKSISERYKPGDEILAAVYSGTVMNIPDFQLTLPTTVSIGTSQDRSGQVTMGVTKNTDFLGQVYVSAFDDWADPANPMTLGTLSPLAFSPDPSSPPSTVTWSTFVTSGAATGIYTVWIKAHSPSPYLTDHYYPVAVNVGGVVRDFSSDGSGLELYTATTAGTATGTVEFRSSNLTNSYFSGVITLSIEGGPGADGVLPTGIGAISPSTTVPATLSLGRNGRESVVISVNSGTLGPGEYPLTLRAKGVNQDGQIINRAIPFTLDVATAGTTKEYLDILGFAIFRIAKVAADQNKPTNFVEGYAISGVYPDMNAPELRRGQVARLVPWN